MKLSRKSFSLFPTQHGFLFLAILIAMLLGSINYNNNAGFILVFLLGGMALISIFHSFKNLVGVEIKFLSSLPVFAGQTAIFPIRVQAQKNRCRSVGFSLVSHDPILVSIDKEKTLQMRVPALERGYLHPKYLTISSFYPFGLFTLRTCIKAPTSCLVYPRPIPGPFTTIKNNLSSEGKEETSRQGADDFQGLKQYQPGHSINRISWRALSRGRGLFVKDFTAEDSPWVMLAFDAIPGSDMEFKLSRLCGMILMAERQQMEYGLRLPGIIKNPARGESHHHNCLKLLSLFDFREDTHLTDGSDPGDGGP
ncbi:MAG: DUF58 domain-containing protein [Desulfobacteraceae bacterium]|nr:DUF58 domain-containing protein [Desulfobacteraceae bacterium]